MTQKLQTGRYCLQYLLSKIHVSRLLLPNSRRYQVPVYLYTLLYFSSSLRHQQAVSGLSFARFRQSPMQSISACKSSNIAAHALTNQRCTSLDLAAYERYDPAPHVRRRTPLYWREFGRTWWIWLMAAGWIGWIGCWFRRGVRYKKVRCS